MDRNIDPSTVWKDENTNDFRNFNSYSVCNVCRLCANICEDVVSIFDEKRSIHRKMRKCLPSILVFQDDMKPKHVCVTCVSKLDSCYSFMEMTQETDVKFEALLQKKVDLVTNLSDKMINNQGAAWISIKEENLEDDELVDQKIELLNSTSHPDPLAQLFQPKNSFSQQIVPISTTQNISNGTPDGVNSGILQNLLSQDTVTSQDVVLLVEVKCKDLSTTSNSAQVNKKLDILPQNLIIPSVKVMSPLGEPTNPVGQQTKIIDTSGHIRVINLADFDGKFNQFDKISSSFIMTDNVSTEKPLNTTNSNVQFLKNFESDVLSLLKFDNIGLENVAVSSNTNSLKPSCTASNASSSIPVTRILSDAKPANTTAHEFRCEICGKQFTRKNRLNAHVARHSSERPYSCDKCDQKFITRWDLTLHLRIHSGVFSCEFCGKAFPARGKLERHRRTHTGERPFPCKLCSRAFSEKRNLHNHMKTHNMDSTSTIVEKLGYSNSNSCTICGCWITSTNITSELFENRCKSCCNQIRLSSINSSKTRENENDPNN